MRGLEIYFSVRQVVRVMLNVGLVVFPLAVSVAQLSLPDPIPVRAESENRYTFPVNPGHQGLLAGTMGELRSTHFHAGIDIRTNNMIGVPIRAAARGYIARVWISSYGYGKALFLKHPNGQTTVYAHLDRFKGSLADVVRQTQYKRKSADTDITFTSNQFPVNAGDTIAFSGNTGGSNGPHLHFEIRDSLNEALNPLSFGFDEIKDTNPPVAQKIALKTLDIDSRINDRFGRFEFYLYRIGNTYSFSAPILVHGRIGVEIQAYDKMDLSGFKCGINEIEMRVDSQTVFTQVINKINFIESRDVIALMDYKSLKSSGARFNKLYRDDRTRQAYGQTGSAGEIQVGQKDVSVEIILRDTYKNTSLVNFTLRSSPVVADADFIEPLSKPYTFDVIENTLYLAVKSCPDSLPSNVIVFSNRERTQVPAAYQNPTRKVYLLDLRKVGPDSIQTCQGMIRLTDHDVIPSGTEYKYYGDWAELKFQPHTLYDTAYLILSKSGQNHHETFSIGDYTTPLNTSVDIGLRPEGEYGTGEKWDVYSVNGVTTYLGGEWRNGRIRFQTQELGNFMILKDTIPPSIRRITLSPTSARFRIKDNLSGFSNFEATINGEWLLMNFDYKTGILQSERLDASKPMKGDFLLRVIDNAGNEIVFQQKIP